MSKRGNDVLIGVAVVWILVLLLLFFSSKVIADYELHTINLDQPHNETVERFISYTDCRKRGIKNKAVAGLFEGRAGFYCQQIDA